MRRLTAIMFTDMVGFTALMQEDEHRAKSVRDRHRSALRESIESHGGEIVQFYGDGTLSVFDSAIEGVTAAVAAQRRLQQDPPIPVRIGIHIGDINHDEDGVYGDGVNVAARIQGLSVPGGVLVSGKVFDEIKNHPGLPATGLGRFELRNVAKPVRIFALTSSGLTVPDPKQMSPTAQRKKAIAVLPFVNMSTDPDNEYFSDGMTEDILAQVSHIGALAVVSHTSVKRYKGTNEPIAEIAAELNVGFVLEGSVRRAGDRVRIVAQLIDVSTDSHLWAETYDRDLTDVFAVQSDVAHSIADALEAELTEDEAAKLDMSSPPHIEAYELVLKGRFGLAAFTETSLRQAIDLYEAALDIQPDYPEAVAGLASAHYSLPFWSTFPPDQQAQRIATLASRAQGIDPSSAEAHFVVGSIEAAHGWNWEKATRELDEAIRLDPSSDQYRVLRALVEVFLGSLDNATKLALEARELNPGDAFADQSCGQYLCLGGRFREAIEVLEPWITREPLHLFPPLYAGASYTALGEVEKGLSLIERARDISKKAPLVEGTFCGVLHALGRKDECAAVAGDLIARSQSEHISGYWLAMAMMATGDPEAALDYLERALENRDPILPTIGGMPRWHPLYGHPRFNAVFSEVFPGRDLPAAVG
jgi:adenylate cyclase